MNAIRRVLADSRRVFGTRRLVLELVGGPLVVVAVALVLTGAAVVL